jgi:hypothetical protein
MTTTQVIDAAARQYLMTPAGGWPETSQAWQQLMDAVPGLGMDACRRAACRALVRAVLAGARMHPSRARTTVRCRAWTGGRIQEERVMVEDGRVSVYDAVAHSYTVVHALDRSAERRIIGRICAAD